MSEQAPARSVAILVDDLAAWLADGHRPTGIQRVVSELLETAYKTPGLRPWPAVYLDGTGAGDRPELVEIARDGLRWETHSEPAGARLRALRGARSVVARLPMPRSLRERAKATYRRLSLRYAGIRPESRSAPNSADLLLVPGGFWMHPETPRRIRHLAEQGVLVRVLVYDLFPITNPEWVAPNHVHAFRQALDELAAVCDRIVVLSQMVADSVIARYPWLAESVRVAVPTLEAHAPRRNARDVRATPSPMPAPFILALSTVEPRKNYRTILDAWRLGREDDRVTDAWLAVVGRRGWMADDIEAEIAREGERLQIRRIDRATDDEVDALYRDCLATVHASWAEGFGLPARESVVRGIPTLMSSSIPRDGLPEGSFRLFEPQDPHELATLLVDAFLSGRVRTPVTPGVGTGWEPVLSALVDD